MKKVARPNTGKHTVVVEPAIRIVQVELTIVGITIQIHHAATAVLVQPEMYEKLSRPPLLETGKKILRQLLEVESNLGSRKI